MPVDRKAFEAWGVGGKEAERNVFKEHYEEKRMLRKKMVDGIMRKRVIIREKAQAKWKSLRSLRSKNSENEKHFTEKDESFYPDLLGSEDSSLSLSGIEDLSDDNLSDNECHFGFDSAKEKNKIIRGVFTIDVLNSGVKQPKPEVVTEENYYREILEGILNKVIDLIIDKYDYERPVAPLQTLVESENESCVTPNGLTDTDKMLTIDDENCKMEPDYQINPHKSAENNSNEEYVYLPDQGQHQNLREERESFNEIFADDYTQEELDELFRIFFTLDEEVPKQSNISCGDESQEDSPNEQSTRAGGYSGSLETANFDNANGNQDEKILHEGQDMDEIIEKCKYEKYGRLDGPFGSILKEQMKEEYTKASISSTFSEILNFRQEINSTSDETKHRQERTEEGGQEVKGMEEFNLRGKKEELDELCDDKCQTEPKKSSTNSIQHFDSK